MADLLLELFSEEIPARMQEEAMHNLQGALAARLDNVNLKPKNISYFSTPRRLAVIMNNLPVGSPDISQEIKGPKVGAPEAAMQGFLKKTGLTIEQLKQRDGIYFANIQQKGRNTSEVLKEVIEHILVNFPWSKSMRWGSGEAKWVRPLQSILCIFDGNIVPVEFAGINAGNTTQGHRFMAPAAIIITDPAQYETALEKAFVMADREKRKASILQKATALCESKKLVMKADEYLLDEITGLVEWPVLLVGKIDDDFMDLPPEVLTTVMRSHQKYFALQETSGKLSAHFLITSNMKTADEGKAITSGNERVLRARFADGRFFWDQDRKKPLSDWAQGLSSVTFHAKLGTVADKVERIKKLTAIIANYEPRITNHESLLRAAELCKADLVTGMVGEFAELQGIMGRYYAQAQNEKPEVADAIRDHYKPQGPGDSVPNAPVSICIALADKLDTLIAMFAINEKPTGSKDPFALRRAALGVIRIVLENNIRLPLKSIFSCIPMKEIALHKAHDKLVKQTEAKLNDPDYASHKVGKYLTINETACADMPEDAAETLAKSLLAFIHDRLIVQLKDSGIRHDVIKAVIADNDDDLMRIVMRAEALQEFLGTDDGKNLLAAYKRTANILAIEEKKDKTSFHDNVRSDLFKENEEMELYEILGPIMPDINALAAQEQFSESMKLFATLRAPIDRFFEKIMVNAEDKNLRKNRLRLLASIRQTMNQVADFSKIEG